MLCEDFSSMCIDEDCTLIDAMRQLDGAMEKVLWVTRDAVFVAALTDGDVRRWILKSGSLEAHVKQFANYKPFFVSEGETDKACQITNRHRLRAIPMLDEAGHIKSVWLRDARTPDNNNNEERFDIPVVIPAGGKGTRLYPYTKILPKPLIPIGDIPISELIIQRFHEQGCDRFYMILNYKKNMIKAYFSDVEKDYALEMLNEDQPLGTGGGLSLLQGMIKETFLFSNCDTLILSGIAKALTLHRRSGNAITMICCSKDYVIPYGVVQVDDQGCIAKIQEKPQMAFLVNTGTYIVEPEVIDLIPKETPISFPEITARCMERGMKVGVFPIGANSWLDMGQIGEMENMKRQLGIHEE